MQDFRETYRALRATPLVTAVAILSLALGIGANTAMFSLVNAMLIRPLPVPDPQRLVIVVGASGFDSSWRQSVWAQIRDRQLLDGVFAWSWSRFDAAGGGERQLVDGIAASGRLFDTLGVRPVIGRLLTPADEQPGGGPEGTVVVISHRFWQRRFGGAPEVLGRSITIERKPFTIVGVTPPEFVGLDIGLPFDIAMPLAMGPQVGSASQFGDPYVTIMGRLEPGQTTESLTAALRAAQPQIREATNPYEVSPYREEYLRDPFEVRAAPGGVSFLRRRYEQPVKTLLGVVGLVLLIACGNIATLLVARAMSRRHELGVRAALGASRLQLARQLMAESLLLSVSGVLLGAMFARWCTSLVPARLSTQGYTVFLDFSPDWRVLGFTAGIGVAVALLFGTAPALYAMRTQPLDALRTRAGTGSGPFGFGGVTVVAQVALSLTLVVLTGLFVRTFVALNGKDVGFERERVLVVTVDADRSAAGRAGLGALYARISAAAGAAAGVESAAVSVAMPGGNSAWTPWIELADGRKLPQGPRGVYGNRISAGWFHTLGTRLLDGREFDPRDRTGAPGVAIVNEAFARQFLKDYRPVGQVIVQRPAGPDGPRQSLEIVGVVEDAMYRFLKESPPPTIYTPLAQTTDPMPAMVNLSVRARGGSPASLSRTIAEAIGRIDRDVSLAFRTLADQVNAQYAQERLVAGMSTFFGVLALLLAALGLYGVTAYAVTRRRFEIAVRMALGATPARVVWMVLRRVVGLAGAGVVLGLVGSLWAGRFITSMLYGVGARNPITLASACILLIAVAVFAGWLPVRRASRIDPANVLREA